MYTTIQLEDVTEFSYLNPEKIYMYECEVTGDYYDKDDYYEGVFIYENYTYDIYVDNIELFEEDNSGNLYKVELTLDQQADLEDNFKNGYYYRQAVQDFKNYYEDVAVDRHLEVV